MVRRARFDDLEVVEGEGGDIGLTVDEAEDTLEEAGLLVCDGVDGPPNGVVIGQNPIADEQAQPGRCVELSSRGAGGDDD